MRASAVLALATWALGGCGGGPSPADGGMSGDGGMSADGGADAEVAASGRRAYDVVITLGTLTLDPMQAGGWDEFPKTFTSTITWDESSGVAVGGGGGSLQSFVVLTSDGRSYTSSGGWGAAVPFASSCDGLAFINLDSVHFSLDDAGALRGTGHGKANYVIGESRLVADADVTLAGTPDATAPTFTWPAGDLDPLAPLIFVASEPLRPDATATLVGTTSGDVVPLFVEAIAADQGAARTLSDRGVALRHDETYRLTTDGLADFAGHAPAPVTVTTRAAPPLAPEDGFESVAGTAFAGAGVLRGGPLQPIAGETSLMLNTGFGGGFGFLPYDLGPSLAVRLAVAPGDTVVRFDAQLIAPDPVDTAAFDGAIRIASVGGTVSQGGTVSGEGFARQTLPGLGDIYINPVKTFEYPLPEGASSGEVTFEIVGVTFKCGLPPSPTVLVVDNLRAE